MLTQLDGVPGESNREAVVHAYLGHACMLLRRGSRSPEDVLSRVWQFALGNTSFPETIYFDLIRLEDEMALAHNGTYGAVAGVSSDVMDFFAAFEPYAPAFLWSGPE